MFTFLLSCQTKTSKFIIEDTSVYERQHTIWKNQRIKSLTATEGWLSLEGLFWLKEGDNSIGTKSKYDILFPEFAADYIGVIKKEGDQFTFETGGESYVTVDDERIVNGELQSDVEGSPTKLQHKSLIFYIIKRGDKYALRLKNTLAKKRYSLKQIPAYPIDYNFVLEANVKQAKGTQSLAVEDVTGSKQTYEIQAYLEFFLDGKKHKLAAFDGGENHYFVIFNDLTSGMSTYGGGRYIYVAKPENNGTTTLDFNRSINPPCAFTDFATCPLPPEENYIKFKIEAGEQYPIY